jgi:uncharacterized Zn finger protein
VLVYDLKEPKRVKLELKGHDKSRSITALHFTRVYKPSVLPVTKPSLKIEESKIIEPKVEPKVEPKIVVKQASPQLKEIKAPSPVVKPLVKDVKDVKEAIEIKRDTPTVQATLFKQNLQKLKEEVAIEVLQNIRRP